MLQAFTRKMAPFFSRSSTGMNFSLVGYMKSTPKKKNCTKSRRLRGSTGFGRQLNHIIRHIFLHSELILRLERLLFRAQTWKDHNSEPNFHNSSVHLRLGYARKKIRVKFKITRSLPNLFFRYIGVFFLFPDVSARS